MASAEYEIKRGRGAVLAVLARNNRVDNGAVTRPRGRDKGNLRPVPMSFPCIGRRNTRRP